MSRRGSEGRSESRAYKIVMYTILITGAIPIILPFYWLVAASLKTKERVNAYPPDWLPIVPADYLKVGGQELRVRIFDDGRGSGTFVARVRALPEHGHLDLPRAAIRRTTADAVFAAVDGRQRRVELRGAPASGGDGVTVALLGQLREVSVPADELESREETETYWTVLGRELRVTPAELPLPERGMVRLVALNEDLAIRVAPQPVVAGAPLELLVEGPDGPRVRLVDTRAPQRRDRDRWLPVAPDVVTNEAAGYVEVRPVCPPEGLTVPVGELRTAFVRRVTAVVDGRRVAVKELSRNGETGLVKVELPDEPVTRVVPAAALELVGHTQYRATVLGQDVPVQPLALPLPDDAAATVAVRLPEALAVTETRLRQERTFAPQWGNFAAAWREQQFDLYLVNTLLIAALVVLGTVFSCGLVGYAFARLHFRGSNILFIVLLSTMMIPGQVTSIPTFVMFATVGWIDSYKPLIVPAFMAGSAFFIFLYRQFMMTIPVDLEDSARIDGCGPLATWWLIMMPLSKPIIVTVAVFSFIGAWNDFLGPLLYINSDAKQTIALGLQNFKSAFQYDDPQLLMAASVMMLIPALVLFFLAQKAFIRGVVVSGVKG